MPQLVRGDEIREVDVVLLHDALDKTDSLRVRNRVGKRLRKAAIPRKLHDPELLELIRAEVRLKIVESGLGRLQHVVEVVLVSGGVINLQVYPLVLLAPNPVARCQERMEVQNLGVA